MLNTPYNYMYNSTLVIFISNAFYTDPIFEFFSWLGNYYRFAPVHLNTKQTSNIDFPSCVSDMFLKLSMFQSANATQRTYSQTFVF